MPRGGNGALRELVIALQGALTLPANIDAAQPAGLIDGSPVALSMDTNGNLRVSLTNIGIATGAVPVVPVYLADTLAAATGAGGVIAPAAGAAIATLANVPIGTYDIEVVAGYGTTGDKINNMDFRIGGTVISTLYVDPAGSSVPVRQQFKRLANGAIQSFTVNASTAGAAGSVYAAAIFATRIA